MNFIPHNEMRTILRISSLCAALGYVSVSPSAHAQETNAGNVSEQSLITTGASAPPSEEAVKEAGQRYDRGLKLYSEGDYALAVIEFERAYLLVPDYRVLYNIGQVRVQLGNYAKARRALEDYLKVGGERIPADRKKAVQGDLDMLVTRTATLRVETNVVGAEVTVDEVMVGQSPLPEALLLDAGEHRVSVQKSGYQPRATQRTLAGRDEETLRLDLEKVPQGPASPIIVQQKTVADTSDRSTWLWATWSATGVLAIGSLATGGLGVKAAGELDDLRADSTATRGELDSASRRARTLLTVGDVLGGLAIVTGGVAIYLTLSGPDSEPGKEQKKKVALVARPNFVGVTGIY